MISGAMLLCLIFCFPLWLKKIGPNPIYGYRTAFSRSSLSNWHHMNRFFTGLFIPFAAALAIADLFLSEKTLVWYLLSGVIVIIGLCFLEERRMKWKSRIKLPKK